jgi:hypothetical protein
MVSLRIKRKAFGDVYTQSIALFDNWERDASIGGPESSGDTPHLSVELFPMDDNAHIPTVWD